MLHIEAPTRLGVSMNMPLSTQGIFPVVSAFNQISLSSDSKRHSLPSQVEDMVTDKDPVSQQEVSQGVIMTAIAPAV